MNQNQYPYRPRQKDEVGVAMMGKGEKVKGKYQSFDIIVRGSANKNLKDVYGYENKTVSAKVAQGLKKRYGLVPHRDRYSSIGYEGDMPKKLFKKQSSKQFRIRI